MDDNERGEHGDDRKADGLHRESWGPVFREDAEADVSIGIDVGMDGNVFTNKDHLKGSIQQQAQKRAALPQMHLSSLSQTHSRTR
ncbi:hypothetical protein E2C01_027511 [Portunus trituberculatus]|uniref:Uncharacterized protein n=1 Tax=Portunus trituberculatus TaxID=210409 RepID=A0A5B7EM62_PORTR|nr:hypothetical protein [Portunus trituberculatus]